MPALLREQTQKDTHFYCSIIFQARTKKVLVLRHDYRTRFPGNTALLQPGINLFFCINSKINSQVLTIDKASFEHRHAQPSIFLHSVVHVYLCPSFLVFEEQNLAYARKAECGKTTIKSSSPRLHP